MKNDVNQEYVEEVPTAAYIKEKREYQKKRKAIIMIIIIIFIALLLLSLGLFFGFFNKKIADGGGTSSVYDLFVVHSKTDYGAKIDSFAQYTTENNAFSYTFYVENQNETAINYSVYLMDYSSNKNINKTNINYQIIKNGSPIFKGVLTNDNVIKLASNKININSKDNYEIKLWGGSTITDFEFKIKVGD